jgi:excisionase family DNA binding protein
MPSPAPAALPVPAELLDALADAIAARVAALIASEVAQQAPALSPWLDFDGACAYLGFTRDVLYKLTAAQAIPVRKKADGQGFRFHRAELDAWGEQAYPRVDRLTEIELSSPVSPSNGPANP